LPARSSWAGKAARRSRCIRPGTSRTAPGWVIARLDEQGISRKHVLLTALPDGQVRVENLSTALPILVSGGAELAPGGRCDSPLPIVLSLDPKIIRIEAAEEEGANPMLRTLREAPKPPRSTFSTARFPSLEGETKGALDSQKILSWLRSAMDVFLSASVSSEFFSKAAQAVVDGVGLDSGRVMILERGEWRTESLHTSARVKSETIWQAEPVRPWAG